MTRAELAERVYERHGGLSRRDAQELLDIVLRLIRQSLAAGERVDIAHFGAFDVAESAPRRGRHPVTGRGFAVPGRRTLVFRPARSLRLKLNGSEPSESA